MKPLNLPVFHISDKKMFLHVRTITDKYTCNNNCLLLLSNNIHLVSWVQAQNIIIINFIIEILLCKGLFEANIIFF